MMEINCICTQHKYKNQFILLEIFFTQNPCLQMHAVSMPEKRSRTPALKKLLDYILHHETL